MTVFKALVYFQPNYANLQHPRFRVLLAHAMLTLGKVPFGQVEEAPEARPDHTYCQLVRFSSYANEKHQCGYCKEKAYFYCATCFPNEAEAQYGICNPTAKDRPCFHKHVSGVAPTHRLNHNKRKRPAEPAAPTRRSPNRAARPVPHTGAGANADVAAARRRLNTDP